KYAREGVVAGNTILKTQELPEQILPINREISEVGAALSAAYSRRQRHHKHLKKIVTPRVPGSRIRQAFEGRSKPGHETPKTRKPPTESKFELSAIPFFQMRFPCDADGTRLDRGACAAETRPVIADTL